MASPTNILTQVQTYQKSNLALLENLNCMISTMNTKFKNFNEMSGNLGMSVSFDLPPRMTTSNGLIAQFQSASQRQQTLTCDQAANVSYEFTAQERIFNVDKDTESYMSTFGAAATAEMSANIEGNVALNANSHVPVMQVVNGQTVPTGALHTESGPYRFYGDALTPINSYQSLAQMMTNFKNYGSVKKGIKVYLPDTVVPAIVGTGLNQFAPKRNDEIANSWEIGTFGTPPVHYYQSNLLPIQEAGTAGNENINLTVVSTNDATGNNITQITFSGGPASDLNSVASGDLIQFQDNVSGIPNVRFLTFIGHYISNQPVQIRALHQSASDGSGNIVVDFTPPLQSTPGPGQNVSRSIVPGMQVKVLPSHRCGIVVSADAFYLAMPKLPNQDPFPSANDYDPETGVSIRMTYGSAFGQNQMGLIHDAIWGSTLVPEYSMRIAFPIN